MKEYDLCITWNWEHDSDFVMFLEQACNLRGLSLLQITPKNLSDILERLNSNHVSCRAFFDRASDTDTNFIPVCQWAHDHGVFCINSREKAVRSWNKAIMHHIFINNGLNTPYTVILPSYEEKPDLPSIDLSHFGDKFIIKPAHGGGGDGVVKDAASYNEVLVARQKYPADRYLLQNFIHPVMFGLRPAWFRVIFCVDQIYTCWWPPDSHIFTIISEEDENHYSLSQLRFITEVIARISELELFSTEIVLTDNGLFVVVDYVNDQIDLRLKSKFVDGVPDSIVCDITKSIAKLVDNNRRDLTDQ